MGIKEVYFRYREQKLERHKSINGELIRKSQEVYYGRMAGCLAK